MLARSQELLSMFVLDQGKDGASMNDMKNQDPNGEYQVDKWASGPFASYNMVLSVYLLCSMQEWE